MPVHDWSRVSEGVFHSFHMGWVAQIQCALNNGLLSNDCYAMIMQAEEEPSLAVTAQIANEWRGDSVISQVDDFSTAAKSTEHYVRRRRTLGIHLTESDQLIAAIEILSPGNKSSQFEFDVLLSRLHNYFEIGVSVLIVDPHKPTKRDPQGIHGAIINTFDGSEYQAPADKRLTLVAYESDAPLKAYIQPAAIGDELIDMPLFLERGRYVNVPLEATYQAALQGMPRIYKQQLTAS